jgi:hypothetical protein
MLLGILKDFVFLALTIKETFEKSNEKIIVMIKKDIERDLPITQIIRPNVETKKLNGGLSKTRLADEPPTLFL